MGLTVYISGKITGTDDYVERFGKAERELLQRRYVVINPVIIPGAKEMSYDEVMKECLKRVESADYLYMLHGWAWSKGAIAELRHFLDTHNRDEFRVYYEIQGGDAICKGNARRVCIIFLTRKIMSAWRRSLRDTESSRQTTTAVTAIRSASMAWNKGSRPPWCDGTIQACLMCNQTDFCDLPIQKGEAEAMRIADSIRRIPAEEVKERKRRAERERRARDPEYRERRRIACKKWRDAQKAKNGV